MARKHAASIDQIAAAEGLSATSIRKLLDRALLKLQGQPTAVTARELAIELESHRASEHTVRRTAASRGGAE
jgi:hypothetical protein